MTGRTERDCKKILAHKTNQSETIQKLTYSAICEGRQPWAISYQIIIR